MNQNKSEIFTQLELIFLDTFTDGDCVISIDTERDDIEEWDSLSHIRLLTAIETSFDIQFDLEEIGDISSVASLVDIIHAKL